MRRSRVWALRQSRQIPTAQELMPRDSLRWRLPMLFGALVVVMLGTFLWTASRAVERTLVRSGHERAKAGAQQVAALLERPLQTRLDENAKLQVNPAIRAFLQNPTDANRDAARQALIPSTAPALRRAELWDTRGSLVLEIATAPPDSVPGLRSFPRGTRPTRAGMSEIRAAGNANFFDFVLEIRDGPPPAGAHLGYLRRFGRASVTPEGIIQRLIGDDAAVRIGSHNAGVWTDFYKVLGPPPSQEKRNASGEYRAADGQRWVGATDAIDGTPWVAWVGFPRALVTAPAQRFMQRMLLLGALFAAVSVALIALLSVRLTQPLRALAKAAEEIAAGDYTQRVANGRRDEIGRLSHSFNTMTDQIEQAYGALRASHEQTQFALAAARIGIWESQLATNKVSCSDSMRLLHGLPADGLPQTRDAFLSMVHVDDRESVRDVLEGRGMDGADFDIQYRALWPDGSIHWIEGKGRTKLGETGRPTAVLGVSIDVNDRRRLESQFRQAQKMEAVGQLAGGVAHDFNNLLTVIVGHGNLILGELDADSPIHEDVAAILKASASAAGLTRQLLAFSRRQVIHPEVIEINDVITRTEKLLRRLIGENIVLVTSLAPRPDAIKADPGQLEQVLVNLAVNARDAMPDGGNLTIASANVDLSEPHFREPASIPPGHYVMLSVSDTGIGMDAETQARVFEPFFTTKAPGKGTGLGLSTVYGIVKQSGGHIYVYSEPGHGTMFKIFLPATSETKIALPAKVVAPKPVGGTETILIVEDDASVQAIAKAILHRMGYRILTASSGDEALRILEAAGEPPALVLSDVIMPGMTGPELYRQLADRDPGIKVLFSSGYSGDAIARHGVLEPGTLFIEKPYTPTALASKVREALGNGSAPTHKTTEVV